MRVQDPPATSATTHTGGPQPRRHGRFLTFVLRACALGAGAGVALVLLDMVLMPRAVRHGQDIQVPNVVGLDTDKALTTLRQAGLTGRRAAERIAPEWPEGVVLEQSLPATFRTRGGRVVELTTSLGRGDVAVPEIGGESVRHAEMILTRSGLGVGNVVRVYDDDGADRVVATSPSIGARVVRGRTVDVLLSRGKEGPAFLMPDLRGSDADAVARALRREGLTVETVDARGLEALAGRIFVQSPAPGHRVAPGTTIVLTVGG